MSSNNKKEVLIKVKGIQGEFGEEEAVEMMTTGTLYEKKDYTYINYIDTYLDEESETKTTVKISHDKVMVIRFGAANATMTFEPGQEQITAYDTYFGTFEIKTNTKGIELTKDDASLYLNVQYNLEVNHTPMGSSNFELHAKVIQN